MLNARKNGGFKKIAWLIIPLLLFIAGAIFLFGSKPAQPPLPSIERDTAEGQLLQLPIVSVNNQVSWQTGWVEALPEARAQVLQALSELHAAYPQRGIRVSLWTPADQLTSQSFADRLQKSLATYSLAEAEAIATPDFARQVQQGVVVFCRAEDKSLVRQLLGALTPYLAGTVAVRFDQALKSGQVRVFLIGEPQFNGIGQATYDANVVAKSQE